MSLGAGKAQWVCGTGIAEWCAGAVASVDSVLSCTRELGADAARLGTSRVGRVAEAWEWARRRVTSKVNMCRRCDARVPVPLLVLSFRRVRLQGVLRLREVDVQWRCCPSAPQTRSVVSS